MKAAGSIDQNATTNVTTGTLGSDVNINQILQQTQPSTFRKVLGGVIGGVANIAAPGLGSVLGTAISGGTGSLSSLGSLGSDPSQFLQLQQQMEQQQEAFESVSNVIKARHDAAMAAIQNIR